MDGVLAGREPNICEQNTPKRRKRAFRRNRSDRGPRTELLKRETVGICECPLFVPPLNGRRVECCPLQTCDSHDIGMAANRLGSAAFPIRPGLASCGLVVAGGVEGEGDIANDAEVIRE